jgi:uncharacterized delta-60 repeat protein
VHRGENQTVAVSVDYTTKDGTAKAGVDYTPAFGTLSFAAGETERTISIPLGEDNGVLDGDRWFSFLLTNATGGAVIESSEVKVFIQDNELPTNLDYSFNPVISPNYGESLSFATLPDGKLVIGGYQFTRVNGVERSGLVCLNADGSLALPFQTRLLYTGQPGGVSQVTPLPDGRLYIAGNFDTVNGVERRGLARLFQDGSLDLSFAPTTPFDYPFNILVQSDGKIVGVSVTELVRLDPSGIKDNSFLVPFAFETTSALAEHVDGKLLVADGSVIRLNRDGSLDNSFGTVSFPGQVSQILVQPDKKILVAGTDYPSFLERLNADGSLDTSFAVSGAIDSLSIRALDLEVSEKIIVWASGRAWRLNADGSLNASFPGPQLRGYYGIGGATTAIKSIGAVAYVYGNFRTINGTLAHGLCRILLDAPPHTAMDIIQPAYTRDEMYKLETVGEMDGLLTVKVRRLGETTAPATVTFATRDGTAKAGKDYVVTIATLSFASLEVEQIVTVPILNNAVFDGFRTLELYLTNAVGAEFVAPPLTMTILDDEFGLERGTIKRLADGSLRMIVQAPPFRTWYLEASNDLKNWTSATNLQWNYVSPFEYEFIDHDAAHFPRRFYRVRTE